MPYLARQGRSLPHGSITTEIERLLEQGTLAETVCILPTGAWARQLQRHAIEHARERTVVQPQIYSLQEFIRRLAAGVRPHKRLISDAEVAVLLELAIRDLFKSKSLTYYEERSNATSYPLPRGTFELIVAAIGGLKQKGVRPNDLASLIAKKEKEALEAAKSRSELNKLRDLSAIYHAYSERLGSTLTDTYGQYFDLLDECTKRERVRELVAGACPGAKQIVVTGFTFLDEPARTILNTIDNVAGIPVIFEIEDAKENPVLFRLHQNLIDLEKEEGFRFTETSPQESARRSIAKYIFNDEVEPEAVVDLQGEVTVGSASSLQEEVRLTARSIKEVIAGEAKGYPLSRIAVVMYKQGGYSRIVQQVFREYGIPTSLTERLPLASSPLFVAVDSLLKLAERGLSPHLILRLLSTPYLEFISGEGDIDRSALYAVINEHRLPPGRWSWQEELEIILDSLEAQLASQDNEIDERRQRAMYERAKRAKADMLVIESLVRTLHEAHTPSEFVAILRKTFYDHGLVRRLLSSDTEMLRAEALEEDTRSYGALDRLLGEFLVLSKALGIESTKLPISYYGERLRAAALKMRYAPHLEPGRGVLVTSIEQVIGMDVDHIFVISMNDDVFPELYAQSALVPAEHQKQEHVHLSEQRYLFYQLLTTPLRSIHFSYERGTASDEKLPSPFLYELKRVALVASIGDQKKKLLTFREFLEHYGTLQEEERKRSLAIVTKDLRAEIDMHVTRAVAQQTVRRQTNGELDLGKLGTEELNHLGKFRDRVYSVSQLETYATCPFKYFEKYVLGLSDANDQQAEEGLSAMDRGLILHEKLRRILEHIHNQRASDPTLDHRNMDAETFRSYDPSPDHDSDKYGGVRKQHPFWRLDLETTFAAPYGVDLFEHFISEENKIAGLETGKGLIPVAFEQEFKDVVLPHPDEDVPPLRLRGKIDRVDFNEDAGTMVVIDYKTRNAPKVPEIEEGLSLQLPLYLRIAEGLIEHHTGVQGVAAYYHTLVGEKAQRSPGIAAKDFLLSLTVDKPRSQTIGKMPEDYEALRKAIDKTVRYAYDYVEGMTKGEFPLVREDRADKKCSYCPYKKSCRVYEAAETGSLPKAPHNG